MIKCASNRSGAIKRDRAARVSGGDAGSDSAAAATLPADHSNDSKISCPNEQQSLSKIYIMHRASLGWILDDE